jgi:hypothetical protein
LHCPVLAPTKYSVAAIIRDLELAIVLALFIAVSQAMTPAHGARSISIKPTPALFLTSQ